MAMYFSLVLMLCTVLRGAQTSPFKQSQAEEECGIYSRTVHQHNSTESSSPVGKPSDGNHGRVHLKGDQARKGEPWPWEVLVKSKEKTLCTGMLIKQKWVLTSASCIMNFLAVESISVEITGGETYKASQALVHEDSKDGQLDANIGLVELRRGITEQSIMPVCLPRAHMQTKISSECAVIMLTREGNGTTKHWESNAAFLGMSTCKDNGVKVEKNKNHLMCIGTKAVSGLPCGTFSAPQTLVCKMNEVWSIFGLGHSCVHSEDKRMSYGYFLKVVPYMKWVKENMGEL